MFLEKYLTFGGPKYKNSEANLCQEAEKDQTILQLESE